MVRSSTFGVTEATVGSEPSAIVIFINEIIAALFAGVSGCLAETNFRPIITLIQRSFNQTKMTARGRPFLLFYSWDG